MKVSLLIATRSRAKYLAETLSCFSHIEVPKGVVGELLVIDNGSDDETASVISSCAMKNFALRGLYHPEIGKAGALNAALQMGTGDIFVLSDDDVRPQPDWLQKLMLPLANGSADAVAGSVQIAPQLVRPWMTRMHRSWLAETDYDADTLPETAVGANMAFSRKILSKIPGFDPELGPGKHGLWEDTLFSLQIREAGFRMVSAPNAVVVHHFEPSRLFRRSFLMRARIEARSSAYVAWHWRHEQGTTTSFPKAKWRLRLLAKHMLNPMERHRTEGISEWEMNLVSGIEYERYYYHERKSKRAYEYRALVKKSN
jgi:glucosyl-dolichyl phosphate glucuronosyltransferase